MAELFTDPIRLLTYDDIRAFAEANMLNMPNILSPLINGMVKGLFTVGSAAPGDLGKVEIDGTNERIVLYDDAGTPRILIGDDGT